MSTSQVLKFGGAALRDGDAVTRATRIVQERGGPAPIVVVSAHEGVTDLLERTVRDAARGHLGWDDVRIRHRTILRQLALPAELLDRQLRDLEAILRELAATGRTDPRVRDFVLSFGERMSARVVAAVLRRSGVPATPLDAFDLGLVREERPGEGMFVGRPGERVRAALAAVQGVPVVTGFLAQDAAGHVVTLGRNGSDLSATWIAEAAGASEVQLWKTVEGIQTADPRFVPAARTVPRLGWDDASELSALGASVLHPGTTQPARRADVPIRLLSVHRSEAPGTVVHGPSLEAGPIALAHRPAVTMLRGPLETGRGRGEELATLFAALVQAGVEPWLGAASSSEVAVVLTGDDVADDLSDLLPRGGKLTRGSASLGIVGRSASGSPSLAHRMRETLTAAGLDAQVAPGGIGRHGGVLLVPAAELGRALRLVHARLFEGPFAESRAPGTPLATQG